MTSRSATKTTRLAAHAAGTGGALPKGLQTRVAILDAALRLAAQSGLEGLSIGALAESIGMSKSGVFAHFGSREVLQIAVIHEYHARFEHEVFAPALREPRGLPRLRQLIALWLDRVSAEIDSGCLYISGAVEFDDRHGAVRDALESMVRAWQQALDRAIRAAVAAGHLRADTDPQQVLFEIHGLVLALHHDARFLHKAGALERARRAFGTLIERCSPSTPSGAPQSMAPAQTSAAPASRRKAASISSPKAASVPSL